MTADTGFKSQRGDTAALPAELREKGYEPSDAPPRTVAFVLAGLLASLCLVFALVGGMFHLFGPAGGAPAPMVRQSLPHALPRPQSDPAAERARIEGAARSNLHFYGWVDRNAGIARIPIADAMRMTAEAGWRAGVSPPVPAAPGRADGERR